MLIKKITTTTLSLFTIGTFELSAASEIEKRFHSVNITYESSKHNLTLQVLGNLEFNLKQIIENKNTTDHTLANAAKLLFMIGRKTSYLKAMDILFNRPNFNGRLYKNLIKSINAIKEIKTLPEDEALVRIELQDLEKSCFDHIQRLEKTIRENHAAQQSTKTIAPQNDKRKFAKGKREKAKRWRIVQ